VFLRQACPPRYFIKSSLHIHRGLFLHRRRGYWLLLRGCVVQSIPRTAAIPDILCVLIWVLTPLIHPPDTSVSDSRRWREISFNFAGVTFKSRYASFFYMLQHITTWGLRLYFHLKEGVLRIFIAINNPSPWPGLNPRPLGPVTSTITTHHRGDFTGGVLMECSNFQTGFVVDVLPLDVLHKGTILIVCHSIPFYRHSYCNLFSSHIILDFIMKCCP
jgi:hypothetical protein